MKNALLVLCSFFIIEHISAQITLKKYIQEALENGKFFQEELLTYDKAGVALKLAKANYLPAVNLNGTYSLARGGRSIDLPLGDLMNPIYNSLNSLNQSLLQLNPSAVSLPTFSTIDNEKIYFTRRTELFTGIEVDMPLYNLNLKKDIQHKEYEMDIKKTELEILKEYKTEEAINTYYSFYKAKVLEDIILSQLDVLEQKLRVVENLYKREKITREVLLSSELEKASLELEFKKNQSEQNRAQASLNNMLGKPLDAIIEDKIEDIEISFGAKSIAEIKTAIENNRGELLVYDYHQKQLELKQESIERYYMPQVYLRLGLGYQDNDFSFSGDNFLIIGALRFKMTLYAPQTKYRKKDNLVGQKLLAAKQAKTLDNMVHQALDTYYRLEMAYEIYNHSLVQLENAKSNFDIVSKRFKVGKVSELEALVAEFEVIKAEKKSVMNRFDFLNLLVEFETQTGLALYK